jgi:hypothetical protein
LLNRPVERVILMEDHAAKQTFQPENAINVPVFEGDPRDDYLVRMIPFLESAYTAWAGPPPSATRTHGALCVPMSSPVPVPVSLSLCRCSCL